MWVLQKSLFLLSNISKVSGTATVLFDMNQPRAAREQRPFLFMQLAPLIFGILFLSKGGVGCVLLFYLNAFNCK